MALPASSRSSGVLRLTRAPCTLALIGLAVGGCSFNLGSLSPSSDREEPPHLVLPSNIAALSETIKNHPNDPKALYEASRVKRFFAINISSLPAFQEGAILH